MAEIQPSVSFHLKFSTASPTTVYKLVHVTRSNFYELKTTTTTNLNEFKHETNMFINRMMMTNETERHKTHLRMHLRSLIRIFTGRILDRQGFKVSSCGQRRHWSVFADAQADLNLRWAHVRRYVFTCYGSNIFFRNDWIWLVQLVNH